MTGAVVRLRDLWSALLTLLRARLFSKYRRLRVLHISDDFVVVDKEPDFLINSNDPEVTSSLQLSLCREFPHLAKPTLRHSFHFVHRLDYATSGVICVALNRRASSAAASAFHDRKASKYYLALVRGHVSVESIEIDVHIGELRSEMTGSHRMTTSSDPVACVRPRPATTRLLVLERGIFHGYPSSKVLLRPITGRRHQLRAHCSHIGHTIVGDFTYSQRKDVEPPRTFLHAFRLTLPNAIEPLDVRTPNPFQLVHGWVGVEKLNDIDDASCVKISSPDPNALIVKQHQPIMSDVQNIDCKR